jgi:rhodanese-related sulfurtransferase
MSTISTITVEQLADNCRRSPLEVIDVRTPVEFREAHLKMARNVPLDSLDPQAVMNGHAKQDQPLYVICKAGGRGATACQKFQQAGCTNVVNVEGGTQAWIDAGFPVVRGKQAMSLERQVRIAAGSLVLLGAVLGFFWNIYFLGLSAFVGAGLVFAGITDTCGMGMILAKMPWNQVSDQAACSSH